MASKSKRKAATSSQWDRVYDHMCAHPDCDKFGGFGMGPITQPQYVRWFCRDHLPEDFWKFRDAVK